MIKSFGDTATEEFFSGRRKKVKWQGVADIASRKLDMVDAADQPCDLLVPPGNKLERLKGARKGEYAIRINDQWRVCFKWRNGNAHEVTIEDYH
jgi:proteic killer suppression protein